MKNTKFRRRALVSSVAMLLVALVALGSATFAWYAADTQVYAQGLSFSTNAASGLLIASSSTLTTKDGTPIAADYSDHVAMDRDSDKVDPCSFDPVTGSYWTGNGTSASDGTYTGGVSQVTALGLANTSYVLTDYLYFKQQAAGGEANTSNNVYLTKVEINGGTSTPMSTMASAIRVVITDETGAVKGEFASTANATAPKLVSTGTTETTKAVLGAGTCSIDTGIDAGQSVDSTHFLIVRVYLDGFDSNVVSDNATDVGAVDTTSNATADDILKNIKLTFTMQ